MSNRHVAAQLNQNIYDSVLNQEQHKLDHLLNAGGKENPYQIGRELGDQMSAACTVAKSGPRLEEALARLHELQHRYLSVGLSDTGMWTNQNLAYTRAMGDMLKLAEVIVQGSINRRESRSAHYRTDFPHRDDQSYLATTVATYDRELGRQDLRFEPVEIGLVPPRSRTDGKVTTATPEAKAASISASSASAP